jgi:phosphatidylinositol kinase/protein kinase (PI-3  family)
MQLFSLVNKLLTNKRETDRRDLAITTYSVIPLSTNETNTGFCFLLRLIGWVKDCDTLQ